MTNGEVSLQTSETDSTPVTTYDLEIDKMYTITVTGSAYSGGWKAWVSAVTDIDTDDMTGMK